MNIECLPKSNADAEAKLQRDRKGILKEGLDACYDIFGDEKRWTLLNDPAYVRPGQFDQLFCKLELAQLAENKEKDNSVKDSVESNDLSDTD